MEGVFDVFDSFGVAFEELTNTLHIYEGFAWEAKYQVTL